MCIRDSKLQHPVLKKQSSLWGKNHFTTFDKVGEGHFGHVFRATHKATNDTVALKRFSKKEVLRQHQNGGRIMELLRREINIHSSYVWHAFLPVSYYFTIRPLTLRFRCDIQSI